MDRPDIPKRVPYRLRGCLDDYLSMNGSHRQPFRLKGWRRAGFRRPLLRLEIASAAAPPRNDYLIRDYLIRGSEQATIPAAFSPEVITTRRSHHLPGSRFSVLIRFHSSGTWSSGIG